MPTSPASCFGQVAACVLAVACTSNMQTAPGSPDPGGKGGTGAAGSSGTGGSGGTGGSSATTGAAGTTMPDAGEGGTGGLGTAGAAGSPGPGGASGAAIAGVGGGGTIGTAGTGGSGGGGGQAGGQAGNTGVAGQAGASPGGRSGAGGGAGAAAAGCDWTSSDGKIVLFDGTSLSGWQNTNSGAPAQWRLVGDGSMEVVPMNPSANIQTTMKFDDLCLHIEYMTPTYPASVTGQQRGNSGIYFRRAYEMQVLDSYGRPPRSMGAALFTRSLHRWS